MKLSGTLDRSDEFQRGYQFHGGAFTISRSVEDEGEKRLRCVSCFVNRVLRASAREERERVTRNELRSRTISKDIEALDHFVKYGNFCAVSSFL